QLEVCNSAREEALEEWILYTDGASSQKGVGAGLVLIDPFVDASTSLNANSNESLPKFAMSSDNASSAVTYTSISSDSNGPSSWGYSTRECRRDSEDGPHVPAYVPEPEHLEYHALSDDDIQVEDQPYVDDASPTAESPRYIADLDSMEDDTDTDSINYPDEPGTNDGDPKEDDDEDPEEDPSEEHDPEDEDPS
ncbi:hypothetical protein Tco_1161575, partial [Tanacetum coccineum]